MDGYAPHESARRRTNSRLHTACTETSAGALPMRVCTLGCAKAPRSQMQTLLRRKRLSAQVPSSAVQISPNYKVAMAAAALSRALGCRMRQWNTVPVCERTPTARSARCTASECKDASGCKDDTRLRGLLLGRVRRKLRRWRASRSSSCWASASAWCSERRIKSRRASGWQQTGVR